VTETAVFIVEAPMSDPALPPPRARELPTTTLQLAGHASESVVQGLSGRSPWMLGIIILNFVGIAAAIFFLNLLIQGQQSHLANLLALQQKNQDQLLEMHKSEFDALLELANRSGTPITPLPAPTAPPGGRR
jgi:hypothetical protein